MALLQNIEPMRKRGTDSSGLLTNRAAIEKRHREKMCAILFFLRTSIYSTSEILGQVAGLNADSAVRATLRGMEEKQLLRRETFLEFTGKYTLWGITLAGQNTIADIIGLEPAGIFFNPASVSLHRLIHKITIQKLRVAGEKHGWSQFDYSDSRQLKRQKDRSELRPDLTAVDTSGLRAAIECELHRKSMPRYKERVIPSHVAALNAGNYDYVVWVCPDKSQADILRQNLKTVIQELSAEQNLNLDKTKTKPFHVTDLSSWPQF